MCSASFWRNQENEFEGWERLKRGARAVGRKLAGMFALDGTLKP